MQMYHVRDTDIFQVHLQSGKSILGFQGQVQNILEIIFERIRDIFELDSFLAYEYNCKDSFEVIYLVSMYFSSNSSLFVLSGLCSPHFPVSTDFQFCF